MSNSDSSVIILTDTESDSDMEHIVDTVFSKVQEKLFGKKAKINGNECNKNTATTTHVTKVSRTKRYSTRFQTKENQEDNEIDNSAMSMQAGDVNIPFFIDTKPSKISVKNNQIECTSSKDDGDLVENLVISDGKSDVSETDSDADVKGKSSLDRTTSSGLIRNKEDTSRKAKKRDMELSSSLQTGLDLSDLYINVNSLKQNKSGLKSVYGLDKNMSQMVKGRDEEIMKKSVITPEFEKQDRCLPYSESLRKLKMERRKERSKTKGNGWFNMPATELTEERKNDLKVLQMRHALDPKRFYRANDMMAAPKYFQFGTVVESKADFYSSRIPKKQRKSTLVDELMADVDFRKFNKRKYSEIQEAKRTGSGPYQKIRFPKKKKKTKT